MVKVKAQLVFPAAPPSESTVRDVRVLPSPSLYTKPKQQRQQHKKNSRGTASTGSDCSSAIMMRAVMFAGIVFLFVIYVGAAFYMNSLSSTFVIKTASNQHVRFQRQSISSNVVTPQDMEARLQSAQQALRKLHEINPNSPVLTLNTANLQNVGRKLCIAKNPTTGQQFISTSCENTAFEPQAPPSPTPSFGSSSFDSPSGMSQPSNNCDDRGSTTTMDSLLSSNSAMSNNASLDGGHDDEDYSDSADGSNTARSKYDIVSESPQQWRSDRELKNGNGNSGEEKPYNLMAQNRLS